MPYQQYNFKPQTFDAQKKRPDLRLLYISHSSYDKTWPSVLHSHPFTELFYVLNGTGTFQTETQTFCIAADDLIQSPCHAHRIQQRRCGFGICCSRI